MWLPNGFCVVSHSQILVAMCSLTWPWFVLVFQPNIWSVVHLNAQQICSGQPALWARKLAPIFFVERILERGFFLWVTACLRIILDRLPGFLDLCSMGYRAVFQNAFLLHFKMWQLTILWKNAIFRRNCGSFDTRITPLDCWHVEASTASLKRHCSDALLCTKTAVKGSLRNGVTGWNFGLSLRCCGLLLIWKIHKSCCCVLWIFWRPNLVKLDNKGLNCKV